MCRVWGTFGGGINKEHNRCAALVKLVYEVLYADFLNFISADELVLHTRIAFHGWMQLFFFWLRGFRLPWSRLLLGEAWECSNAPLEECSDVIVSVGHHRPFTNLATMLVKRWSTRNTSKTYSFSICWGTIATPCCRHIPCRCRYSMSE